MYVANVSLSQRSPHQRIVVTSPKPWTCAISWRMVSARRWSCASLACPRWMYASLNVTHPGFSIAPMLNSGTKSWLYSSNGYRQSEVHLEEIEAGGRDLEDLVGLQVDPRVRGDSRHHSAIGMSRCLRSTMWYLPATTAIRYGGSGGVVLKCHTFASPRTSVRMTDPLPQTRQCLRRGHRHRHPGLEVGLVEAGQDLVRIERLEVGVHVDLAVDRVRRRWSADAGVLVLALRGHREAVGAGAETA